MERPNNEAIIEEVAKKLKKKDFRIKLFTFGRERKPAVRILIDDTKFGDIALSIHPEWVFFKNIDPGYPFNR